MRQVALPWTQGIERILGGRDQTAPPADRDDVIPRRDTARVLSASWERLALSAILVLAGLLNLFRLKGEGYGNTYYAATVKSMLTSWHNFFFVSFDPGGFVTVDKPPVGFWIQALSARLLGFSGLSLLLPQAIAGILSVALIYVLVRRPFGEIAALLAALVMAISPVAVAVNRNNTIDALLILTLLGAVWCVLRAVERSSLRWLLAGVVLVGLGFNIKMMQAYLVLPALYLAYLLGSRLGWRTRFAHLALASLVLLGVSLSWAVAVDLTPAAQRPYVGSSGNNSELNLALGYNGLLRLLPSGWLPESLTGSFGNRKPDGEPSVSSGAPSGGPGFMEGGPSAVRLFSSQLAGQISWLLPLAAVGGVAAWWQTRTRFPLSRRQTALVLWGTWLAAGVCFFSVANSFTMMHSYYLAMLAPPIAALSGIGLVALWRDYRRPGWRGWLLPAAIAGTVALHVKILADYPDWSARLAPLIVVLGILAAVGFVLARAQPDVLRQLPRRILPALATVALVAILTAPAIWAGITTWDSGIGMLPSAGPAESFGRFGSPGAAAPAQDAESRQVDKTAQQPASERRARGGMPGGEEADAKLIAYLEAHHDGERFLFATTSAMNASPYILATDEAVAALGGFSGGDPILTTEQLASMIDKGEVRYFLVPVVDESDQEGGFRGFADNENVRWIKAHCTAVPEAEWQTTTNDDGGAPFGMKQALFDCAGAA